MVAVAYVASRAPASAGAACPCAVLGVSRDRGQTFTYRVLKNISVPKPPQGTDSARPGAPGGGSGGLTAISADPTKAGRLAMLKSEGASYSVATSGDDGETWSPFVTAATVPEAVSFTKPAFEYSRNGVLGLMWRAVYADRSYDIWAAVSRDGGARFSRPLRVSRAKSPAFDPYRNSGLFGDDIQDLSMDRETMHLVWGDSRSGFQGVWYGRVRLADFAY